MNRSRNQPVAFAAFRQGVKGRVVVNAAKEPETPVEILLIGPVGASWWSEEGIRQRDVIDAIEAVPAGRKIILGVNSTGGAVEDGLGIYNAIKRRSSDITVRIDGYACSIASVFPLAAGRVITPKASVWMIHNAWSGAVGNARDMEVASAMLKQHDNALAAIYSEHTGKTREECAETMAAETWFSGEEAHAWGLADEMSDDEIDLEPIEASPFAAVPPSLRVFSGPISKIAPFNQAFRRDASPVTADRHQSNARTDTETKTVPMNKIAILALLKKHGVTINDNATEAELNAKALELVNAGKFTIAEFAAAAAPQAPAPVQAPAPAQAQAPAQVADDVSARLASLERQNADLRRAGVEARVDAAIRERRIPNALRSTFISAGMTDAAVLEQLATMPVVEAGVPPVVEITAEAPVDILAGIEHMRRPVEAVCRGDNVRPQDIERNALAIARAVRAGGERLMGAMNATTISADLKRAVLLNGAGMRAFRRRILPLRIWSTVFGNVPLEGTDEVTVPYMPLFTESSTDFVTEYVFNKSRAVNARKVTVNKRKYQPFDFTSTELARQPFFMLSEFIAQSAEQLAVDVFTDVLSAVTLANYGAAVKSELPDAFTTDDIIDIRGACNAADWPTVGRSLVMDDSFETALLKDMKDASATGDNMALREGSLGNIAGFRDIYANNRIPQNAQKLVGFATLPSAMLVATSPIIPAPGVRKQLVSYDVVTDPDTGISFEYRYWGDPGKDGDRSVVECNYGFAVGEGAALLRLALP